MWEKAQRDPFGTGGPHERERRLPPANALAFGAGDDAGKSPKIRLVLLVLKVKGVEVLGTASIDELETQ